MTFSDIKDIKTIITRAVSDKIDDGQRVNMTWAVTDILNQFPKIEGDDVDFYLITARYYVHEQVKACVKKYEPSDKQSDAQIVLDGFEHLQKAYPIDRKGSRELVPIEQMTDQELDLRAFEYDKMSKGCADHAAEIRHYRASREQAK